MKKSKHHSGQFMYELKPIMYAAIATFSYKYSTGPLMTSSAALLAVSALFIIYMRACHRRMID